MEFKKYSSIENTYQQKTIDKIYQLELDKGNWAAELKIHGSNFAIYYDGENIKYAKRSGFIEENEDFFNYQSIQKQLNEYAKKIWDYFLKDNPIKEITLCGELFGGNYPNIKSQTTVVRRGIYYSPNLHFYVFDIKIDDQYIGYLEKEKACQFSGIPVVPTLMTGSLKDCLNFNPRIEDPIYKDFNLPKVKNNFAEGVVIKPFRPKFFPSGSRIVLKHKNKDFKERIKKDKKNENSNFSPEIEAQINNISEYINENRLLNVLSKKGEITWKDFGDTIKAFNQDIIEDYLKDFKEEFENLEKSNQRIITAKANKLSTELLKKYLKKNL